MKKKKREMKKVLSIIFLFMATAVVAQAQTEKPLLGDSPWQIIVSDDITLQSGVFVEYEFPADTGYDYVLSMTHGRQNVHAVIVISNVQDSIVSRYVQDQNSRTLDCNFWVDHSASYKALVGITDPAGARGDEIVTAFSLVRKKRVEE
ncbi:MAG: hypothetical protein H6607_02430 [Flavobacteriales bacterium]|nr:hypothetical protein [Flavobacteriales bacterium]